MTIKILFKNEAEREKVTHLSLISDKEWSILYEMEGNLSHKHASAKEFDMAEYAIRFIHIKATF